MNTAAVFVLGVLVGWVIEWIIDWVYWRGKMADANSKLAAQAGLARENEQRKCRQEQAELEKQITALKLENSAWQQKVRDLQAPAAGLRSAGIAALEPVVEAVQPDDLIVIKGIGPVIAKKLNAAGVYTFRQLGALTPAELRAIVGDVIQRLANEEDILRQARQLAGGQNPVD